MCCYGRFTYGINQTASTGYDRFIFERERRLIDRNLPILMSGPQREQLVANDAARILKLADATHVIAHKFYAVDSYSAPMGQAVDIVAYNELGAAVAMVWHNREAAAIVAKHGPLLAALFLSDGPIPMMFAPPGRPFRIVGGYHLGGGWLARTERAPRTIATREDRTLRINVAGGNLAAEELWPLAAKLYTEPLDHIVVHTITRELWQSPFSETRNCAVVVGKDDSRGIVSDSLMDKYNNSLSSLTDKYHVSN